MLSSARKILKWILIAGISTIILIFSARNYEPVTISLFPLPFEIETPVFLLILLTFMLGTLAGCIASSVRSIKWRHALKQRDQRIQALENELAAKKQELAPPSSVPLPPLALYG